MQLFMLHLETGAGLWEKDSSREKVNIIIPFYFCVISIKFLPVCGNCAYDYACEHPVLCSKILSKLLQCRYCMAVRDLLDHPDNPSLSQLCCMSLFLNRLSSILEALHLFLLLLQLRTVTEPHRFDMEIKNYPLSKYSLSAVLTCSYTSVLYQKRS